MIPREFVFDVRLDDVSRFGELVNELATSVLRHAGYPPTAAVDVLADVQGAVAGAPAADRSCEVQFRASRGELHVVLTYADGRVWRLARPLP